MLPCTLLATVTILGSVEHLVFAPKWIARHLEDAARATSVKWVLSAKEGIFHFDQYRARPSVKILNSAWQTRQALRYIFLPAAHAAMAIPAGDTLATGPWARIRQRTYIMVACRCPLCPPASAGRFRELAYGGWAWPPFAVGYG